MADAIAINKADGDNAKRAKMAKVEFNRVLHMYPIKASNWQPKVVTCSAIKNDGIEAIYTMIAKYLELTVSNNYFYSKRNEQNKFWLIQTIEEQLKSDFFSNPKIKIALQKQLKLIENNETTPFVAAEYLLSIK